MHSDQVRDREDGTASKPDDVGSHALETVEVDASKLFSLRKPKDLPAGIISAGKSILKGVGSGIIVCFAAPAVGAFQEGWLGFAKGIGVGVVGAVLLPIAGVGVGLVQIVRGAINTPEAIRATLEGRVWDKKSRQWIKNPGSALIVDDDDFVHVRHRWQQDNNTQTSTSGRLDSEDFYEMLGVSKDASPEQIKRKYYILARKMHPDKNPNDPEAKVKFQKLAEAYQVLGDPDLRQKYDENGKAGIDTNFMEASEFFTMLFGSEKFEHLIGELIIAAVARNGGDFSMATFKKIQVTRVEKLATMLKALLRRWVEGDEQGFQESMQAEAKTLADTVYGARIMKVLGKVYELQANAHIAGMLQGIVSGFRSQAYTAKVRMSAAKWALKTLQAQQNMERLEREHLLEQDQSQQRLQQQKASSSHSPEAGQAQAEREAAKKLEAEQKRQEMEEATLPLMLDAMWAANVMDIESTVRSTCRKALNDPEVSKSVNKSRAHGLKALAYIFQETAASFLEQQVKTDDIERAQVAKQRMEETMQKMVDKRNARDDELYGHQ